MSNTNQKPEVNVKKEFYSFVMGRTYANKGLARSAESRHKQKMAKVQKEDLVNKLKNKFGSNAVKS